MVGGFGRRCGIFQGIGFQHDRMPLELFDAAVKIERLFAVAVVVRGGPEARSEWNDNYALTRIAEDKTNG